MTEDEFKNRLKDEGLKPTEHVIKAENSGLRVRMWVPKTEDGGFTFVKEDLPEYPDYVLEKTLEFAALRAYKNKERHR